MVYIHDCGLFNGMPGFSGFSSMRVALFITSLMSLALFLGICAFVESKGKLYRAAYLVPVIMLTYQLLIYLLNARDTTTNEFSVKIIFQVVIIPSLILGAYYVGKKSKEDER
tara:strand:- start:153 stop:488 length:336 start_codon:yes stop_codon:yes gene_type:complete